MHETLYGPMDDDPTALEAVRALARERGATKLVVSMHQRKPWNARMCQHPGSLLLDFQLDGDRWYAVRQYPKGKLEWFGLTP